MSYNPHIESAIKNGYDFKIGDYFNKGLEIFKKNPGGYLGYVVVYILISTVIDFLPSYASFFINIIVGPSLICGFAIAAYKQEKFGSEEFGNFFRGFDFIAQLLVANIITYLMYFALLIPLILIVDFSVIFRLFLGFGDFNEIAELLEEVSRMGLIILIIGILFIYISISLRWTNYLIVFHKYDAVEAIKTSWKLVNKNWFMHFVFLLLFLLAMFAGLLALIIGLLFVFPILMLADYEGFADITGLNKKDDIIDEIGSFKDELV